MIPVAGADRYRTVQVTTCSPGQLLVMLYDGVFRFLREAMVAIDAGDRGRSAERLTRSHAILAELVGGLDAKIAPELCENLEAVYLFCMGKLVEANLHQDKARVEEVLRVLSPLRDAWTTAVAGQEGSP